MSGTIWLSDCYRATSHGEPRDRPRIRPMRYTPQRHFDIYMHMSSLWYSMLPVHSPSISEVDEEICRLWGLRQTKPCDSQSALWLQLHCSCRITATDMILTNICKSWGMHCTYAYSCQHFGSAFVRRGAIKAVTASVVVLKIMRKVHTFQGKESTMCVS
jgi:hypothetical protein